jgi:uncharacterized phage protein gp47/JayE
MSTSNVPSLEITSTGVSVPQSSDVLTGVLSDLNNAFGGNLNITSPATPQGYLGENLTYYITNNNALIAYLMTQFDPQTAEGRWQDAIARIYFLTRKPPTATAVTCQLIGQPSSTLAAGAQATDGTYIYELTGNVTFPAGGVVEGNFENLTKGNIPCPANTLNKISTAQFGWDAINNESAGVNGNDVESRYDFEIRREESVAVNSNGTLDAIRGAVFSVADVIDVYAYENPTSSSESVGVTGYSVLPHSVYIAVVGGIDADIAKAIWTKKSGGCNTNGNTTVTVSDTGSGLIPAPTYTIKFNRPTPLPIYFLVKIGNSPLLPTDYVAKIKASMISAFNGDDGNGGVRIGSELYASRFYAGIVNISTNLKLVSVLMSTSSSGTPSLSEISVGIDQIPTIDAAHITVTLV